MSGFKVGDRVRYRDGEDEIIESIMENGDIVGRLCNSGNLSFPALPEFYTLIKKGGTISKYEKMRQRIEALDNGWDKEADDILVDMGFFKNVEEIKIDYREIAVWVSGVGSWTKFSYSSQCQKMRAFKDALLFILDHSDIKKDEKQEKIAELEGKLKELSQELKELKG